MKTSTTPSIRGTQTERNIVAAFVNESQTCARYYLFAEAAKKQKEKGVAKFFEKLAECSYGHATTFFELFEGGDAEVTGTYSAQGSETALENLRLAAELEHENFDEKYPEWAQAAKDEGFIHVAVKFEEVIKCKRNHEQDTIAEISKFK